ncbi:MAG: helix-turn-helix domain-containing protein [Pseudomonadota bacterium]
MIDQEMRRTILALHEAGQSQRTIARALGVSRSFVQRLVGQGTADVPERSGASLLSPHLERVRAEVGLCKGNLIRVHEELVSDGIEVSYSALTRFVKKHEIGRPPTLPTGRYDFAPGVESQFDTSPHDVDFRDGARRCQCASLILGYSRMLFFQYYPRFTRFEAKVFLTEALRFIGGACARCIVDNTNLVVLHGTGANAVMVPEMKAFGDRFDFKFLAHEIGDANRSGKVERPFHYIENNFLVKRVFEDFGDLNRKALDFCDKNNRSLKKHLRTRPVELFAVEQPLLKPLPPHIPEVYDLHHRIVDLAGYVNLHRNCYSAPWRLIGECVEAREGLETVRLYHKHREIAVHDRLEPGAGRRSTHKTHRPPRGEGTPARRPLPQEERLRKVSGLMDDYVAALKKHCSGRGAAPLRRLDRMQREYPEGPFERAVTDALHYGLFDMARLERMVLRNIAGEYFRAPWEDTPARTEQEDDDE